MNESRNNNPGQKSKDFEEIRNGALPLTLHDALQWPREECWELIDGVAYAPVDGSAFHNELMNLIKEVNEPKGYRLISRPDGIAFPEEYEEAHESTTLLRPHLALLENFSEVETGIYTGEVKFLVVISNLESEVRDNIQKLAVCEAHGVSHYWIVNLDDQKVYCHALNNEKRYDLPEVSELGSQLILPQIETRINFSKIIDAS